MSELEIKANAEQYALKRITSTDLSTQARDKILIQDAYEKGFNDCYVMAREEYEKLSERNVQANDIIRDLYFIISSRIDYKDNIPLKDEMNRVKDFLMKYDNG